MYPNIVAEFNSTPWAIRPEKFHEIHAFLTLKASGGSVSAEELAAMERKRSGLREVRGKVAVVPIMGTILNRAGGIMESSGLTTSEQIGQQVDEYMRDSSVSAIVARIDSPGGMVTGTPELAEKIYSYRGQGKKLIASCDGDMCSAALWIGSAFDEVFITPSGTTGSHGVIWEHVDDSAAMEAEGFKSEYITYGEYKAEGRGPMTDSLRERMQEIVNDVGDQFTASLAKYRGQTARYVKENFGQGRTLMPKEALKVQMVDGIKTYEEVVNKLIGATSKTSNSVRRKRLAMHMRN